MASIADVKLLLTENKFFNTEISEFRSGVIFENETLLGCVVCYETPTALIDGYQKAEELVLTLHSKRLRYIADKAWNFYSIHLSAGAASVTERAAMSKIEEDLAASRKIARAGVESIDDIKMALQPILPIAEKMDLGRIQVEDEIREAVQLPDALKEVIFSSADIRDAVEKLLASK
jgi:hypothetical protein